MQVLNFSLLGFLLLLGPRDVATKCNFLPDYQRLVSWSTGCAGGISVQLNSNVYICTRMFVMELSREGTGGC